jgi:hypothetical protein
MYHAKVPFIALAHDSSAAMEVAIKSVGIYLNGYEYKSVTLDECLGEGAAYRTGKCK